MELSINPPLNPKLTDWALANGSPAAMKIKKDKTANCLFIAGKF